MKMRWVMAGLILVLALPSETVSASAPGDRADSAGNAVSPAYEAIDAGAPPVRSQGFSLCPGIADTAQVLDKGIDYPRSPEFTEAMVAVADGSSPYAPAKLPPEWRRAAESWRMNVAGGGKPRISIASGEEGSHDLRAVLVSPAGVPVEPGRIGLEEQSCNSSLLFRASIEYRARVGREDAPLWKRPWSP